ncbi:glycoside hydrolase family 130 protein [uncultured Alistipes sp.]|uniref:glycoside hydrolase family 130 protein n=1 Tax=uncultured Alistipes sp. TaxID=538949 RepID=UPI002619345E|nr:glycoside hydrolase family 130 protein [uncultured Alistipes sp.]
MTIVSRRCVRLLILAAAFTASACAEQAATAPDWVWTGFRRPEGANPVIAPDTATRFFCPLRREWVAWQEGDTFNPAAAVRDGRVVLLYRAEDRSGEGIGQRTSRLGCACSDDGVHFERLPEPVFYPDVDSQTALEWPGGVEDPRIVQTDEGLYVMFYTQWNRRQARLAVATSRDLLTWHKHGPAFAKAHGGRFRDAFSKSASPVTRVDGERQTVARIGGRYWMYWGEKFVNVAVSDNLTDWTPLLGPDGELLRVLEPRDGYFDSELTECGPPAVVTDAGILLLYNGKNAAGERGDGAYTPGAYCAGQALFDAADPTRLKGRLDKPFFVPEADFERSGQYPAGTVFIEGLVLHDGRWFLYYGCADSRVGVAVREAGAECAARR